MVMAMTDKICIASFTSEAEIDPYCSARIADSNTAGGSESFSLQKLVSYRSLQFFNIFWRNLQDF